MMATAQAARPGAPRMQRTVRRLIVYSLLFVLVVIAASGAGGLLGQVLGSGSELASGDVGGLAQSLAFVLVGGPLAAALWMSVWRRLRAPAERSSLAWGLYVAAMYIVALVSSTASALALLSALAAGRTTGWWVSAANATVWGAVWLWHRWMWRHSLKSPVRLAEVPAVAGTVYGLVLGAGGAVTVLGSLFDAAIDGFTGTTAVGKPWWVFALQALVWAVGGWILWWWHWFREGGVRLRSRLADAALVLSGILAASVLAIAGWGTLLFVLLRLAFDRTEPVAAILEPLGSAAAAGLTGSAIWMYHQGVAAERNEATRQAARLVVSGAALAAAATGVGVIVNSALAIAGSTLAGTGPRTLLLGGISALAVGGPLWWGSWRPGHAQVEEPGAPQAGRRVYLIAVFGVSAVVALVTLLVIGYRVFELVLDGSTPGSLVDRIRAPLGLLVATGLAAGYHFSVWRHERPAEGDGAGPGRGIRHLVLVAGSDAERWRLAAEEVAGRVTVWKRAGPDGAVPHAGPGAERQGDAGPAAEQLARALAGAVSERVLVIAEADGRLQVIELED